MKNFPIKSLFVAFIIVFSFLTVACKDDHDHDDDPQPASANITFTSPAMYSAFNGGQTVTVAGKIEASHEIHGYKIIIRNKTTNTETVIKDADEHAKTVDFSADWTNNVTTHSDMEAEVVVTLDHNGNTTSQKVSFHCMP
jgi:hypothetical protein